MPGWDWVWSADIADFPNAVRTVRFPLIPNLGDIMAEDFIERAAALGPLDGLAGGPPCQDFSIAGLRDGLAGVRGNLSMRWVQIIHALRPRWTLTENVPGWLSVNDGHAFGAFLAGLVGHDSALLPPKRAGGRWTDAGMVAGPLGRAAWRILDAQYFGLAQRRARVFVVGDLGAGGDPAAVLFEPGSLRGHPPPRRQARQDPAGPAQDGAGAGRGHRAGGSGHDDLGADPAAEQAARAASAGGDGDPGVAYTLKVPSKGTSWRADGSDNLVGGVTEFLPQSSRVYMPEGVAPAVQATGKRGGHRPPQVAPILPDTVPTLDASYGRLQGASHQDANHGHSHLVPLAFGGNNTSGPIDAAPSLLSQPGSGWKGDFDSETFIAHTLRGEGFDASEDGTGRGTPLVAVPIMETGKSPGRRATDLKVGDGIGKDGDPMFTLTMDSRHGVFSGPAEPIPFDTTQVTHPENRSNPQPGDPAGSLPANGHPPAIAFHGAQDPDVSGDVTHPCGRNQGMETTAMIGHTVRRLTPMECERLQGFPDGWTAIPTGYRQRRTVTRTRPEDRWERGIDPKTGKAAWVLLAADGPRYGSIGNSMAVPVLAWIGRRIAAVEAEIQAEGGEVSHATD